MSDASQKEPYLVFWKVKEGRNAFRLARFHYYNLTIKVVLEFMVYACLNYYERLTDMEQ